jgi:uncharacterized protein (TIGR00255 family)
MAFRSMTGFGHGRAAGALSWEVEISSVNRKQADVRVNLPRGLAALESRVVDEVRKGVARGAISVSCRPVFSGPGRGGMAGINGALAKKYLEQIRAFGRELGLEEKVGLKLLLGLPGVLVSEDSLADAESVWPVIRKALADAVKRWQAMRVAEGRRLQRDMQARFRTLVKLQARIRKAAPGVAAQYRDALRRRLAEAGCRLDAGDGAVAREVAMFADRSDVSEEIVRLDSHFQQYESLSRKNEAVGRTLDFLCQEMLREINTIGSKANDAVITTDVIAFKSVLEALREQAQNVE